ncbi:MAG TPA: hypothetical protein VK625_23585 [Flavitalea sp.]|nr:hypothetical protein [Flavitalea sp.]
MRHISFWLLFLLFSCDKKDECAPEYHEGAPISVEGPSTAQVGTSITLSLSFAVYNGCGQFSRFQETTKGNKRIIKPIAVYPTCSLCTADIPTRHVDYKFSADQPGTYYLQFEGIYESEVLDTIVVH